MIDDPSIETDTVAIALLLQEWDQNGREGSIDGVFERLQGEYSVIAASASGEILYKEKLAKKVNSSHKTVLKIVDDLLDEGSFIKMPPHTNPNLDARIINIRPSVDVTVAFIDYNIRSMINSMKFITAYTKIKLQFEFDYDKRKVV